MKFLPASLGPIAKAHLDDCLLLACKGDSLPDSVPRALLTLLLQNASQKELERCAVYLFQTTRPHLRKYGISKTPKTRKKSASALAKNRYAELLSEHWCESRLQAICFEGALAESVGGVTYSEEDKAELSFCTELTDISAAEFEDYIALFEEDWEEKGPLDFIQANCRKSLVSVLRLASKMREGTVAPALDLNMKNRFVFVGSGTEFFSRYQRLTIPDAIQQLGLGGWKEALSSP